MDRASTFADEGVLELLRERFVPVALDVWYHERRQDPEGEFYRHVVAQREGVELGVRTTQGFYVLSPDGTLLEGWNQRDPARVRQALTAALASYRPVARVEALADGVDPRFARTPPEGAALVRVLARVVEASYAGGAARWDDVFRGATGRDLLWILQDEVEALLGGTVPDRLARRLARFHLVDTSRGEPDLWAAADVRGVDLRLAPERRRLRLSGTVRLATPDGARGFEPSLFGYVEARHGRLTRFDVVALGSAWGAGTYTQVAAPDGRFVLAVAFTLAPPEAAAVPPQGARDLAEYLGRR